MRECIMEGVCERVYHGECVREGMPERVCHGGCVCD